MRCDVMGDDIISFDWKQLVGKQIKLWYDDGSKIQMKIITVEGVDQNTIFFSDGDGISLMRYIRHEVLS